MSFEDVQGQSIAVERLKRSIAAGRLLGTYLFSGPEGVGKSLAATTVAKALNCEKQDGDSCDKCLSCRKIDKQQHPDLHIIDAQAGETGVRPQSDGVRSRVHDASLQELKIEYVRQLQREINMRPFEALKKVFIIHDAHTLNAEASNAFLKTLEEMPLDSVIILLSSKPSLLFKTILSRCKTIKFAPMKRAELESLLARQHQLDNHTAHFLAYFCDGKIGEALSLKGQDVLGDKNKIIDEFMSGGPEAGYTHASLTREMFRQRLNILASWFRDVYMIKTGAEASEVINIDRSPELMRFAERYSLVELNEIVSTISESLAYISQNINVKLLLSQMRAVVKGSHSA